MKTETAALSFLGARTFARRIAGIARRPSQAAVVAAAAAGYGYLIIRSARLLLAPSPAGNAAAESAALETRIAFATLAWLATLGYMAWSLARQRHFHGSDVNFVFPAPLDRTGTFRRLLVARVFGHSLYRLLIMVAVLLELAKYAAPVAIFSLFTLLLPLGLFALASLATGLTVVFLQLRAFRLGRTPLAAWAFGAYGLVVVATLALGIRGRLNAGVRLLDALFAALNEDVLTWLLLPARGLADASFILETGAPLLLASAGAWTLLGLWAWSGFRRDADALYDFAAREAERHAAAVHAQHEAPELGRGILHHARSGQLASAVPFVLRAWRPEGVLALVWHAAALHWRLSRRFAIAFAAVAAMAVLGGAAARATGVDDATGIFPGSTWWDVKRMLFMSYLASVILFAFGALAQGMALPRLEAVEVLKPMPFLPTGLLLGQALGDWAVACALGVVAALAGALVWPSAAVVWLLLAIALPTFVLPVSAAGALAGVAGGGNRIVEGALKLLLITAPLPGMVALVGPPVATLIAVPLVNAFVTVVLVALTARAWEDYLPQAEA